MEYRCPPSQMNVQITGLQSHPCSPSQFLSVPYRVGPLRQNGQEGHPQLTACPAAGWLRQCVPVGDGDAGPPPSSGWLTWRGSGLPADSGAPQPSAEQTWPRIHPSGHRRVQEHPLPAAQRSDCHPLGSTCLLSNGFATL